MSDINKMKQLISELSKASEQYYKYDNPIMSDKKYDDLMDELEQLENETGIIMNNSPLHKVQGEILESLKEVQHTRPMLSANKTKDINKIKKFIGDLKCIMSWKLDGLTIVLRYKDGEFIQAITRGREGLVGEDVTHTMKVCQGVPMKLPFHEDLEVRGECVISWCNFRQINDSLENKFSHPRNLAAGSVRQLDANIAKERNLEFKAFELVQENRKDKMNISDSFDYLAKCGFDVVEWNSVDVDSIIDTTDNFDPKDYEYPVDGLIFTYDNYKYGKSLGATAHHPLNMIALKWEDDLYETELLDIEWSVGKTGTITPVAVFKPVTIDGSVVEKATLHNISIMNQVLGRFPYKHQQIRVYKANKIIPAVYDSELGIEFSDDYIGIPGYCPSCGEATKILNTNGTENLMCYNTDCSGKLIGKLKHFVSKNAINIEDLSEATLKFLVNKGWLTSFIDIFSLDQHKDEWVMVSGYGKQSVEKILNNIQKSRNIELYKFLNALSIPQIGFSTSKDISNFCHGDIDKFLENSLDKKCESFYEISGFGKVAGDALNEWLNSNSEMFNNLLALMNFKKSGGAAQTLAGKIFVITGKLEHFKNRDEMIELIESLGGKVSSSVSKKTNYLINNDLQSTTGKNKKAQDLGIPIISEKEFNEMCNG